MLSTGLLRALCAAHWNPIGVRMRLEDAGDDASPLPDDEYDRYLAEVCELLEEGAGDDEIVRHLAAVERYMDLTQPSGDKTRFVAAVRHAWRGAH